MAKDTRRVFVFTRDERGALKMLINTELHRLLKQTPRNETMIEQFRDILDELGKGQPMP